MQRRRWLVAAAALATLFTAAVFGVWLDRRILGFDALRVFAPYYSLIADFAAQGRLLLWEPWSNCGSPAHAYVELGSFSPLTVAHAWLTGGGHPGFELYWLAIWVIGGVGMLALARALGAPVVAGLAVAVSFSFSGFWLGHASHTSWLYAFAFLPWILCRVDRALASRQLWPGVEAGALYGLSALAGHPALVVNNGLFVAGWVCARLVAASPRPTARGALVLATIALVGAVVLAPAYVGFLVDAAGYADRVGALDRAVAVADQPLPPVALATFASPYLARLALAVPELFSNTWAGLGACYVGALIPALSLLALAQRPRDRFAVGIALLGLLFLAAALGDLLPVRGWLYDLVPPTRYFRHAAVFRAHFLFALAVLALVGARALAGDREAAAAAWRRLGWIAGALGAVAAIAFAATLRAAPRTAPGLALAAVQLALAWVGLPVLCVAASRRRIAKATRAALLLGLVAADGALSLVSSLPLMTLSFEGFRPDASRRNHSLDLTERGLLRDADPSSAVGNRHLSTRTPTVESFNTLNSRFHTRSGVGTANWQNLPASWSDVPVLRFAVSGDERVWFSSVAAEIAPTDGAFAAYVSRSEELGAPPIVIHSRDAMLAASAAETGPDAADAAARIAALPSARHLPVRVSAYLPETLRFSFDAPEPGWLLVTDRWARGWHASLDGRPSEVWGGSFLFRALRVDAGIHEVEFRYVPTLFPWLLVASWGTLACVAAGSALRARGAEPMRPRR
jgi:hypothetical protein